MYYVALYLLPAAILPALPSGSTHAAPPAISYVTIKTRCHSFTYLHAYENIVSAHCGHLYPSIVIIYISNIGDDAAGYDQDPMSLAAARGGHLYLSEWLIKRHVSISYI